MINKIKELRKAGGYRQEDLAEALGVSRQTIIAIENNKDTIIGKNYNQLQKRLLFII